MLGAGSGCFDALNMELPRPVAYLPVLLSAAVLALPTSAPAARAHVASGKCVNRNTPATRISAKAMRTAVLCLVNKQRAHHGLPPLHESRRLDRSAQSWSNRMVRAASFTHGDFTSRLSAVGYHWSAAGENIASGFATPWSVIRGWMGSPDHCRNILSPQFHDLGVGVNTHRLGIYGPSTWTEDFGLWMGHHAPSHNTGPQNGCPYRV
jgi:uncharacterized protein YkwD